MTSLMKKFKRKREAVDDQQKSHKKQHKHDFPAKIEDMVVTQKVLPFMELEQGTISFGGKLIYATTPDDLKYRIERMKHCYEYAEKNRSVISKNTKYVRTETANWYAVSSRRFGIPCMTSDGEIDVLRLLLAGDHFGTILETQESIAFIPVRKKFNDNVKKMTNFYYANQTKYRFRTLREMIVKEVDMLLEEGRDISYIKSSETASCGMLWFTRALQFLLEVFANSLNDDQGIAFTNWFLQAYNRTLIRHHNAMMKPLFAAAMKCCPELSRFIHQTGGKDEQDKIYEDARVYFAEMQMTTDQLVDLCNYLNRKYKTDVWDVDIIE